jgi:hypothetical protein
MDHSKWTIKPNVLAVILVPLLSPGVKTKIDEPLSPTAPSANKQAHVGASASTNKAMDLVFVFLSQ